LERRFIDVLRGVTLEIGAGEFFGLLGPNGAGKTTLFKILSTLVSADRGDASVGGASVRTQPHRVRGMLTPVIADERSLSWRLTGEQNLLLFAALYGLRSGEASRRARDLLEIVGLTEAASRMVAGYSSGMRQRLLIARALLSRPAVLLLDEPTRSLDPVSARDLRCFLRDEVATRHGCTVLLATHDADEAFDLCDRLAVLHRGHVVASGTAPELADLAGARRYRAVVHTAEHERAVAALASGGWSGFTRADNVATDWCAVEADAYATPSDTAHLVDRMVSDGVRLAEFSRVPISLADLVERLVARGAAA
jgi:ABC-type multidrug transport system ATPase subunit